MILAGSEPIIDAFYQCFFFRLRIALKKLLKEFKINVFLNFWYFSPPQAENFDYFCTPFAFSLCFESISGEFSLKIFLGSNFFFKMRSQELKKKLKF